MASFSVFDLMTEIVSFSGGSQTLFLGKIIHCGKNLRKYFARLILILWIGRKFSKQTWSIYTREMDILYNFFDVN